MNGTIKLYKNLKQYSLQN